MGLAVITATIGKRWVGLKPKGRPTTSEERQRSTSPSNLATLGDSAQPYLSVRIANQMLEALIDTGSSLTLVDTPYKRPELGRINSTQTIHTATGQEVSLDGPYEIDIDIDYIPTQVYFTQGVNNGIPILGSDFLRARSARIDYSNNTLELDGHVRPLALPGQLASVGPLDEISKVVLELLHLFEQKGILPAMDVGVEMSIETEGGPISLRPYRAALSKRFIIDKEI